MKLSRIGRLSTVIAGSLIVGSVLADATTDARKGVETTLRKMDTAFNKKDAAGVFSTMSPDFMNVQPDGSKQNLTETKKMFGQILLAKSVKSVSTIKKFALKGNLAVATVDMKLEIVGNNPQTGKPSTVVSMDTSTDSFIRKGSAWLFKESKTITDKTTVDGKLVSAPTGK